MFSTKTNLTVFIVVFLLWSLPMYLIAYMAYEHIPAVHNYIVWSYSGWRLALIPPMVLISLTWSYITFRATV